MNFVKSHFRKMNFWPAEHFFEHICHHIWVGATANQEQTHPKVMINMLNKVFNWSEVLLLKVTSYKIHTLVEFPNKMVISGTDFILTRLVNGWISYTFSVQLSVESVKFIEKKLTCDLPEHRAAFRHAVQVNLCQKLFFFRTWGEHVVHKNCSECQKQCL